MTLLDSVGVSTVYSHKLYISHNAPYEINAKSIDF